MPQATTRARNERQKLKEQYAKLRERAMEMGLIETTPQGALLKNGRNREIVDPATQSEQNIPSIDEQAIKRGWAVPEEKKPAVVDNLLDIMDDVEVSPKVKTVAARALLAADQVQYERDNPIRAGQARGAAQINQTNNTQINNFNSQDWMSLISGISVEDDPLEAKLEELRSLSSGEDNRKVQSPQAPQSTP